MVQLYQFPTGRSLESRYGCQVLSQHPRNGGLPLATITLLDVGGYICPHNWPVVALGMGPMR